MKIEPDEDLSGKFKTQGIKRKILKLPEKRWRGGKDKKNQVTHRESGIGMTPDLSAVTHKLESSSSMPHKF